MPMTHYVKHLITCAPDCTHEWCDCPCADHSETCWPGRPDPSCTACQQDELPEEDT